ncbi:hypothetical protein [uncultured Victivallis sp.]|uniref:hypothetical protein n=1 Tax=uncultured Victivallis sp. TaxID=354118 RepID=UPI0025DEB80B|nr:hypothetical protein [uncultured Victivallis sp.]
MKRQIRKYPFNMVEIALAMAIIAIGLSGILVLFPVGINASKSAIADNNLADIAEYIMGYLQAGCNADWIQNANAAEGTSPTFSFAEQFPVKDDEDEVLNSDQTGISLDSDGDPNGFSEVSDFPNLFYGDSHKVFYYRQMTGDVVDFAAVIKIWRVNGIDFMVPKYDSTATPPTIIQEVPSATDAEEINKIKNYARSFYIEISWPVELPNEEREKRIFRLDIFNQAYKIPAATTP